eukprot:1840594-Alexandrium_andersonii.AAC.1
MFMSGLVRAVHVVRRWKFSDATADGARLPCLQSDSRPIWRRPLSGGPQTAIASGQSLCELGHWQCLAPGAVARFRRPRERGQSPQLERGGAVA